MKRHTRFIGNKRYIWHVERLRSLAEDLAPFEVEINLIPDLDYDCWFGGEAPSIREVAKHMKRVQDADLSYPVILNSEGCLMDGGHRCCKALLNGEKTILAVRFEVTPEPDGIENVE